MTATPNRTVGVAVLGAAGTIAPTRTFAELETRGCEFSVER
jgi:hypothetical protein